VPVILTVAGGAGVETAVAVGAEFSRTSWQDGDVGSDKAQVDVEAPVMVDAMGEEPSVCPMARW